jgi:hypothetical protein
MGKVSENATLHLLVRAELATSLFRFPDFCPELQLFFDVLIFPELHIYPLSTNEG